ncbi:DgyrCDS13653 [Dimorphilus gyrociliatus]|uniref:DgyrCDS13653 n=1 Tax=Dimorphilus gyrociliatus TaxID=2664684 RepID=A0A7I8WBC2_9ANNE|nr:DgyrCDS13653 [Dimorphilus gyrociliatus]
MAVIGHFDGMDMKRGGSICQAVDFYLVSHLSLSNRVKQWVFDLRNIKLINDFKRDPKVLWNRRVCSDHFSPDAYTSKDGNRLLPTARPLIDKRMIPNIQTTDLFINIAKSKAAASDNPVIDTKQIEEKNMFGCES